MWCTTISAGMDATGSSLPSTAHSISRALTAASTSTLVSKLRASRKAGSSSAALLTLLTPTDEPALAGLTNTGKPSWLASAKVAARSFFMACAVTIRHGTTGMPAWTSKRLVTSLSMPMAEPK